MLESKQLWKLEVFKPKSAAILGRFSLAKVLLEVVLLNISSWYLKYVASPPCSLAQLAATACSVAFGSWKDKGRSLKTNFTFPVSI